MYEIKAADKPTFCPKCGVVGPQSSHGYKTRYIRDLPNSGMQVILKLRAQRYLCPSCGATYMQTYKTIDETSMTPRLRDRIVQRILRREPYTRIADDYGISDKTVRRAFDDWDKKHRYMTLYTTPRVIGIDEAHIDKHFRLIITDPEHNSLQLSAQPKESEHCKGSNYGLRTAVRKSSKRHLPICNCCYRQVPCYPARKQTHGHHQKENAR